MPSYIVYVLVLQISLPYEYSSGFCWSFIISGISLSYEMSDRASHCPLKDDEMSDIIKNLTYQKRITKRKKHNIIYQYYT